MAIAKQSPWQIQKAVVFALIVRELNARFGRFRLGYAWAILEPLALITILSCIRLAIGRSDLAGLPYPVFFASGIMPFLLFQHIVQTCLMSVEANQSLFNYQRVKPSDTVVSRVIIETVITLASGALIFTSMYLAGLVFTWNNTLEFLAAASLCVLFASGLGLGLSVIGPLWQESKKIVPVIIRPFFFISGIFFAAGDIPEPYRSYLLWNPLLHVTELIRSSMFAEYQEPQGSFSFLGICTLVSLTLGLMIYRSLHLRVQTSGNIR